MNVLLLNPPGRLFYTRDYFCSKVTKVEYAEHPVDLLMLSGIIGAHHQVTLLDAMARRLSVEVTLGEIERVRPEAIIFLAGSASWKEDFPFMEEVRRRWPHLRLIGLGDLFLNRRVFDAVPWLDAVLHDFTTDDVLRVLEGKASQARNLFYRSGTEVQAPGPGEKRGSFEVPVPRHELFLDLPYTFPFARYHPFATLLTDFGCPFACRFCLYSTLGFRQRPVSNVVAELERLRVLGVRELFVKDQAFGADRARAVALCDEMVARGPFSWTCFMRATSVDADLLRRLRQAGCHTIMFGVESAGEEILTRVDKRVTVLQVQEAFRLCRQGGMRTVGIFILGFPGEDEASCRRTIQLAVDLDCDFASFNVFVPKHSTPMRAELEQAGRVSDDPLETMDQSGIAASSASDCLSAADLDRLRTEANRTFYLRPSYVL
ncbi:MAG TPA: radical SAM protein, partial [Candidatus Ozemobacteraceae bacterium]|nr:radical SAM protein [Candidatus Ozemobacteraceae bacterium]